jgi:OTU domain-containing protein 5
MVSVSEADLGEVEESKQASEPATNEATEFENNTTFQPGDYLDVQDTVGKWCEAQIVDVDTVSRRALVTYLYWSDTFNEWLPLDSNRLARKGSMTFTPGGELRVGHRIEARDTTNRWIEAEVVDACENEVRIHYKNWHQKFDENLPRNSDRIRPYGHFKVLNKKSKPLTRNRVVPLNHQDRVRKTTLTQFSRYENALNRQRLGVREIDGDGNCLFRSISHQIYGDDSFHMLVREKCMEYMMCEKEYFKPFVEGNMSDYVAYLNHKSQPGVWGDDPEIQACCELYNRPAEIWCYDPVNGAKKMRTFHEVPGQGLRSPMRLSYYGGGHYDSVVSLDGFEPLSRRPPGEEETNRIALAQERNDLGIVDETKEQSDVLATEQEALSVALQVSRDDFERLEIDLDVLFEQQTELAIAAADSEQVTQDMLLGAEQRDFSEALQLSAQVQQSDLDRALAMSAQHVDDPDPELQHALLLSKLTSFVVKFFCNCSK